MTVLIPGARDVRATLDKGDHSDEAAAANRNDGQALRRLVVACPPHPQMGGDRRDGRLRAVSDELTTHGIDCLRIDYGPWDGGEGEITDVINAIQWAQKRADSVGLFGYSFGGTIALLAADHLPPDALSVLAPGESVIDGVDPVETLSGLDCPVQLLHGERDDVVESTRLIEQAKTAEFDVQPIAGDHFFVGQQAKVATLVGEFFDSSLSKR